MASLVRVQWMECNAKLVNTTSGRAVPDGFECELVCVEKRCTCLSCTKGSNVANEGAPCSCSAGECCSALCPDMILVTLTILATFAQDLATPTIAAYVTHRKLRPLLLPACYFNASSSWFPQCPSW